MENFAIIKIFVLTALAFITAILSTPILTHFLYKYKFGKKIREGGDTPIMSALHAHKSGTPSSGGILVWGIVLIFSVIFWLLATYIKVDWLSQFNFLSRSQTLLPLGAMIAAALVGLFDDIFNVKGWGKNGNGIKFKHKIIIFFVIALVGAYWFYYKLDWDVIHVPFGGNYEIGWWYIPVFIAVIVGTAFAVNQTDGLDGLAGGTMLSAYAVVGAISFSQGRYDLATFCGVIVGALMAFLWFNIPPARFFMGDTGSMSLGITLGIVAMLTNTALLLPVIGIIFVLEAFSTIIQILSKKFFKRKVFLSAPIHHHFEAIGWSEAKIVMRAWVIACVAGVLGLVIALLDKIV